MQQGKNIRITDPEEEVKDMKKLPEDASGNYEKSDQYTLPDRKSISHRVILS